MSTSEELLATPNGKAEANGAEGRIVSPAVAGLFTTPAMGSGATGTGLGSPLTSVMGSLIREGIASAFNSVSEDKAPILAALLTDEHGRATRPSDKAEAVNEIVSLTMASYMAAMQSDGAESNHKTEIARRMAQLQAVAEPAKETNAGNNPMIRLMAHARQEMLALKAELDEKATTFVAAKTRHEKSGTALGKRMVADDNLRDAIAEGVSEPTLKHLQENADRLRTQEELRVDLKATKEFMRYCEDAMWETLLEGNVREDKGTFAMLQFPGTIDPADRKVVLATLLEWSQQPAVVKRYSLLIPEIRSMATVMDPVTGVYAKPRQSIGKATDAMYTAQKQDLALRITNSVTSVDFTSLWKGSVHIGATGHRELYPIDELSGLDMLYAWIAQYVLIEKGGSRTDLLLSLQGIEELFKAPTPMATNEPKIRALLDNATSGGVYPEWLTHGMKCVRAVVNRGQEYSDACKENNLRNNTPWERPPKCHDVTRMLLDLITITKDVDDREHSMEDDGLARKRKRRDVVPALAAEVTTEWLSEALQKKLGAKCVADAANVDVTVKTQVHALLTEKYPDANLSLKKHDGKLVAGEILLGEGQKLTLKKVQSAAKYVSDYAKRPRGNATKECEAANCQSKTAHKYCKYHHDIELSGRTVWRKDGDHGRGKGKSSKGKGRGRGKGKGGKGKQMKISVADTDNKVQSYSLDARTVKLITKLKNEGAQMVTEQQAETLSRASSQSDIAGLLG